MRKKYEEILDRMYFEIGSTLIDNDFCRKGIGDSKPVSETEIVRSNRKTYMNLKVMMMRLERELFGEKTYEKENKKKIPNRDTRRSENTVDGCETTFVDRIGNFSC